MENLANHPAPQKITILGASKHNNLLVQVGNKQREVSTDPESLKQLLLAAGQVSFEVANKTYNIGQIEEANFQFLIQQLPFVVPKYLTLPPFHSEVFLGREQELQAIKEKLFSGKNFLLLVNGTGGVGKTSLASRYYHQYRDAYAHVAWLLSERSISSALLLLAESLGLQFEDTLSQEQRLQKLLQAMAELQAPVLLVIDNANELDDLKANYQNLRRLSNFHLLLTTRITEYREAETYQIVGLPLVQAKELFTRYYKAIQASEDLLFEQIYYAVEGNTLVLELMAKNLHLFNRLKTNYSLQDLLTDLQHKGLLSISKSQEVETDYGALHKAKPEAIVAAMYDLGELSVFEKRLLSVFAVLPAESISFDHLETLLPATRELESNLLGLSQKGWLDYDEARNLFKVSPVIQHITRGKNPDLREDCQEVVAVLIEKLNWEGSGHYSDYQLVSRLSRYASTFIASFEEEMDKDIARLSIRIGKYHEVTGNLRLALEYFQRFHSTVKVLFAEHPNSSNFKHGIAIANEGLGRIYFSLFDLNQALQHFEQYNQLCEILHEDFPNDLDYRCDLAISFEQLGKTHSSLGNLRQALKYYEQSNQRSQALYETYPNNVLYKSNLAISYGFLGDSHSSLGNLSQALQYYEQYYELSRDLNKDDPDNGGHKNSLAVSLKDLGDTHSSLGNLDQALKYHEQYYELSNALCKSYPDNVLYKNNLAISYGLLGDTHSSLGNFGQALQYYEQCKQQFQALRENYPDNVDFINSLAVSLKGLGNVHSSLGNLGQALQYYEQCKQQFQALRENYPDNVSFINSLAVSLRGLGITHSTLGNLDQALKYHEQYYELSNTLCKSYPDNVLYKSNRAISHGLLGDTHSSLGNLGQALQYYEQCKQQFQALRENYPDNVDFINSLAVSFKGLGNTHSTLGNLDQALKYLGQYYELSNALCKSYSDNVLYKNNLAISYGLLGKTHSALGNLGQALEYHEQCNQHFQALRENYPDNVDFINSLAISYGLLGDSHFSLGNLQQALTFFEKRNQLGEELYTAYPQNVSFKKELALSYQRLGWFYKSQYKDQLKAREHYLRSQALFKELVASFPGYSKYQQDLEWIENKLSET